MNSFKMQVFIAVALSNLAISVIMPILTPLTRELGLADSQGGWIVTMGSISMAISAALWGKFTDQRGRRAGFIAGFIGIAVGYAIFTSVAWSGMTGAMAGTTLFVVLVLSRSLIGGFLPAIPSAAQAMIADNTPPEKRHESMALIGMGNGVGMVIGPIIGGVLAMFGLLYPLIMTVIIALFGLIMVISMPISNSHKSDDDGATQPRFSMKKNGLWGWMLSAFLCFVCVIGLQIIGGYYIQDSLNVSGKGAAAILSGCLVAVGVALIATQMVQMKVLKWKPKRLIFTGAPLFMASLALLMSIHNPLMYYTCYGLIGMACGLMITGVMSGASIATNAKQQGRAGGVISGAQGLGAIVAPIGSTTLYEMGYKLPFYGFGILLVIMLIVVMIVPSVTPETGEEAAAG